MRRFFKETGIGYLRVMGDTGGSKGMALGEFDMRRITSVDRFEERGREVEDGPPIYSSIEWAERDVGDIDQRYVFVGDVHGCYDELLELLRVCRYSPDENNPVHVVSVGDLVGKGPKSPNVVRLFRTSPRMSCVRGNHEEFHLQIRRSYWTTLTGCPEPPDGDAPIDAKRGWEETFAKLSVNRRVDEDCRRFTDEDWAYMESLPYYLTFPAGQLKHTRDVTVIHAGLDARYPLEKQTPENMTSMRNINQLGEPTSAQSMGPGWAASWPGPDLAVFGHDAVRGLQVYRHAIGLDTGCCYGKSVRTPY